MTVGQSNCCADEVTRTHLERKVPVYILVWVVCKAKSLGVNNHFIIYGHKLRWLKNENRHLPHALLRDVDERGVPFICHRVHVSSATGAPEYMGD